MKTLSAMIFGFALLGACAEAQTAQTTAQTAAATPAYVVTAPNAHFRLQDIESEQWAPDDSILVRTQRGDWYHATLMGGCSARGFAAIGFTASSGDVVDRGSSANVGGQRCQLASVDQIEPPPGQQGRH